MQYVLGLDNMVSSSKFMLEEALMNFHGVVRPGENLLKAKLVRRVHYHSISLLSFFKYFLLFSLGFYLFSFSACFVSF